MAMLCMCICTIIKQSKKNNNTEEGSEFRAKQEVELNLKWY